MTVIDVRPRCRADACRRLATRAGIACDRHWRFVPANVKDALLRPVLKETAHLHRRVRAEVVRLYLRNAK